MTIDASDASGSPLDQSSGLALAGSLASSGPFGADIGSLSSLDGSGGSDLSGVGSSMSLRASSTGLAAVSEPSTILLTAVGLLGLLGGGIRRRCPRIGQS